MPLTQTELLTLPYVNALVRAYYRPPGECDIDIQDAQGSAIFALEHAEKKSGVSIREVDRLMTSDPLQFLDSAILLGALGDLEHNNTPVPGEFRARVDINIRRFLVYFIDASYGSPTLD